MFDTTIADAIASGEIKLAYIPESPTENPLDEDPFDTKLYVEVFKKIEEEERKEKRKVNLGLAVNVLTGTCVSVSKEGQEKSTKYLVGVPKTKGRPRPQAVNLLGSFDENSQVQSISETDNKEAASSERAKDIFDIDASVKLSDQEIELLPSKLVLIKKDASIDKQASKNLKDIISEFETLETNEDVAVQNTVLNDFDDSEFDELAFEHLQKGIDNDNVKVKSDDPFDTSFVDDNLDKEDATHSNINKYSDVESCSLNQPVENFTESEELKPVSQEDVFDTSAEDVFDTSAVHITIPCAAHLKLLEEEFLKEKPVNDPVNVPSYILIQEKVGRSFSIESDFDFNPREDEPTPIPSEADRIEETHPFDTADEIGISNKPLTPAADEKEIDPFDTGFVSVVVHLPGKSELRQLEKELVSPEIQAADVGFSERQELNIQDTNNDPFNVPESDLNIEEPLNPTPYSHQPRNTESIDFSEHLDPFDTSTINVKDILTSKFEIKELEHQFLSSKVDAVAPRPTVRQISLDKISKPPDKLKVCHPLDEEVELEKVESFASPIKPIPPVNPLFESAFDDPFCTKFANIGGPGQTEIKLLERELQNVKDFPPANITLQYLEDEVVIESGRYITSL